LKRKKVDMKKLQTVDDFRMLCGRLRNTEATGKPTIVISAGTCGQASGANDLIRVVIEKFWLRICPTKSI
jgi:hypothetical protein